MYRLIIILSVIFLFSSCVVREAEPSLPPGDGETDKSEVFVHTPAEESWLLIAEGKYLNLYHINGEKRLKNSEQIDLSVFPDADAGELKKGIKFDTVHDAYTVMEGFIN